MPKGVPLTEAELAKRRQEISAVAIPLFVEKGFNETNMRTIAAAAGMGKSTLYDYFNAKDEILISYFAAEIELITARSQEIVALSLPAAERLRRVMAMHLQHLVANKNIHLKLSVEMQRLSLQSQQLVQRRRHAYQDMLCELIEEGIGTGEFRPIKALFAVRSLGVLLANAVYTSRPSGTPEEMLAEAVDILFHGIGMPGAIPPESVNGAAAA